ncbi:hypothetical protein [Algibacter sp. L3A6]|uniref:hypothetical protein n=1 Tax=Algibacter sp. L3A6 TaxID=2686366 RepID=UPI00131AF5BB|nr:hypothetical protein [Algibacter sp. L3A6]
MPTATQSDNSSNSKTSSGLLMDEFLPLVKVTPQEIKDPRENTYLIDGDTLSDVKDKNGKNEETTLSKYIDEDERTFITQQLTTSKDKIKLSFKVKKGSVDSDDDDGIISVHLSEKDPEIKITSKQEFTASYNTEFNLELEFTAKTSKAFYIDFHAKDDDNEEWNVGELKNVHCGRIKVIFKFGDRIGIRLTSNIEGLIRTPSGYDEPPTYSEPLKTFDVANVYQNPYGMCFAVSMARVRKAYLDEFGVEVISLNLSGQDYLYSGTVVNNIPPTYFGYGVGGTLAMKGYAELVSESEIWEGKLKEGAMIQYWNGTSLSKVLKKIKKRDVNDPQYGHSVVFKSYIKIGSKITGMKIYDYSGIYKQIFKVESKIVLGANLKDIQ